MFSHVTGINVQLVNSTTPTYLSSFISCDLLGWLFQSWLPIPSRHISSFPLVWTTLIQHFLPSPSPIPMEILAILQDPVQMSSPLISRMSRRRVLQALFIITLLLGYFSYSTAILFFSTAITSSLSILHLKSLRDRDSLTHLSHLPTASSQHRTFTKTYQILN